MLLQGKVAIIHGGGGAIGGAVARVFAREGARVYLCGRTRAKLDRVVRDIVAAGGRAEAAEVDALDEHAVEHHVEGVALRAGCVDIALNAIGFAHVQGTPFVDLSLADFAYPVEAYARTNFLTAQAVGRRMVEQGAGVILTLSTPGARISGQGFLGNGVASAAIEAFSRILAGELGASGVRVVCLRPDAIPEALAESHSRDVFAGAAARAGSTIEALLDGRAQQATLLKRLPTLCQVAEVAAFMASDRAAAMTGTVANLSCGSIVD